MPHWTTDLFVEHAAQYATELDAAADRAREQVDALLDTLDEHHGHAPASVLDVACGVGRHAVPFADRGLHATGLDVSPAFVARARERAADAGVADRTRFVEGDMRALGDAPLDPPYDLVTCLFTSVGFFDESTNRDVFAGLSDCVAPDGALVVEVLNKEGMLADFQRAGVTEVDDLLLTEERDYDPATSRVHTTRRYFEPGDDGYREAASVDYDVRLYAPVELAARLRDAGFDAVALYGDYDGVRLETASERVVAVAEP